MIGHHDVHFDGHLCMHDVISLEIIMVILRVIRSWLFAIVDISIVG